MVSEEKLKRKKAEKQTATMWSILEHQVLRCHLDYRHILHVLLWCWYTGHPQWLKSLLLHWKLYISTLDRDQNPGVSLGGFKSLIIIRFSSLTPKNTHLRQISMISTGKKLQDLKHLQVKPQFCFSFCSEIAISLSFHMKIVASPVTWPLSDWPSFPLILGDSLRDII